MSWGICAVLSVLLLAVGLRQFLNKARGPMRMVFLLLCLCGAVFVAYIPPYLATCSKSTVFFADLLHMLRVITLDADYTEFFEVIRTGIHSQVLASLYLLLLGIEHLLLPVVSAMTAVTVLLRCYSSLRMYMADLNGKPIYVFSQMNERSLCLAADIKKRKGIIIFAGSDVNSIDAGQAAYNGYIFKAESIAELRFNTKRRHELHFFSISDDEDASLSATLRLIDKYASLESAVQARIHIYQFTRADDFAVYIDSADKGELDVRCINEYETQVYRLLDEHPLFTASSGNQSHVLLYGLSDINMVFLRALSWCSQLNGCHVKVSVIGKGIQPQISLLQTEYPGLFSERYDFQFYNCTDEKERLAQVAQTCADASYVVVSDATDNATLHTSLQLRRLFYRLDEKLAHCPGIYCYIHDTAKFEIAGSLKTAESKPERKTSYSLLPFGSLKEVYNYENVIDSTLERLAKNVHLAYEEIFSDGEIDVSAALKRYNIFEVNKRSCRANALHIRYKLHLLGLDYTEDETAQPVDLSAFLQDDELRQLTVSEHDRWMAFLESEGWLPATLEQVSAYRASGISKGRHNCPLLKMHPYICAYEQLKQLSLTIEGKDTTVYDKELITRIPDILGDKWNAAGKKYTIIKKQK